MKNLTEHQNKNNLILSSLRGWADNSADIAQSFDAKTEQTLSNFKIRWLNEDLFKHFFINEEEQEQFEVALIMTESGQSVIHVHEEGCALLTPLGATYGFANPGAVLLKGEYQLGAGRQKLRRYRMQDDQQLFIPPYAVHGFFTSSESHILAVTYPRIMNLEGEFDVHELQEDEWEIID